MSDPITMLTHLVPAKYSGWILFFVAILPYLTRGLHAFVNRGSFRDVLSAVFFGTNTPAQPTSVAASVMGNGGSQGGFALVKMMFLMFLCSIVAIWLVGCGTTANQATFRTVGTTQVAVDTAMAEWNAYVGAVHPPISQEQAVKAAFEKYQSAMAVVCDAGAVYSSANQTNAPQASAALQTAIANANSEITDLESLITSFGVQLK